MTLVIDASVAIAWLMPDESSPQAEKAYVLASETGITVPALFEIETRNILLVNERRRRISAGDHIAAAATLALLPRHIDAGVDADAAARLAREAGLSVYDAVYLELAERLAAPLATLDRKLAEAASGLGIETVTA